jgi:hypothetical protein
MTLPQLRLAVADHFSDARTDTVLEACRECGALLIAGVVGDTSVTQYIDTRTAHAKWHKDLARTIEANAATQSRGRYSYGGGR